MLLLLLRRRLLQSRPTPRTLPIKFRWLDIKNRKKTKDTILRASSSTATSFSFIVYVSVSVWVTVHPRRRFKCWFFFISILHCCCCCFALALLVCFLNISLREYTRVHVNRYSSSSPEWPTGITVALNLSIYLLFAYCSSKRGIKKKSQNILLRCEGINDNGKRGKSQVARPLTLLKLTSTFVLTEGKKKRRKLVNRKETLLKWDQSIKTVLCVCVCVCCQTTTGTVHTRKKSCRHLISILNVVVFLSVGGTCTYCKL